MVEPKLYFITFGGGSQNYYDAVDRLTNQAKQLNIFDKIIGYTDDDLKKDLDFWNKHSNFILKNNRGYGYWLWKSYLIMKTLKSMNNNDILIYLDSGCEIDIKKKNNILECIEMIKINNITVTTTPQIEKKWNKMDLIKHLNMYHLKYINSKQIQAGVLGIKKCDIIINFVNDWYNTCCDYHLIDDSPSIINNDCIFKEHRHDQSVFSLLFKKYKFNNNYSMYNCIEVNRNISSTSMIK